MNDRKMHSDLEISIGYLTDNPTETRITEVVGILRRCLVRAEGLEHIWADEITDYEKASIMKERGFKLTKIDNAIRIDYLGYYLRDLTEKEITELLA